MKKIIMFLLLTFVLVNISACDKVIKQSITKTEHNDIKTPITNESQAIVTESLDTQETLSNETEAGNEVSTTSDNTISSTAINIASPTLTFDTMKTFKEKLTNMSFDEGELVDVNKFPKDENGKLLLDPDDLYDIEGVREEFTESNVSWSGNNNYSITFSNGTNGLISFSIMDEIALQKQMEVLLSTEGNYDALRNNKNVSNLTENIVQTDLGETHISTFDTKVKTGLKVAYTEFTYNGIDYIVSNFYSSNDNALINSKIFIFNGDQSTSCLVHGVDKELTFDEITALKLVPVE